MTVSNLWGESLCTGDLSSHSRIFVISRPLKLHVELDIYLFIKGPEEQP